MIKVKNLSRKYGDLLAVDNVSLEISHGEVVGLLGHNGAGKTTLMKLLTGFLESNSGEIEIDKLKLQDNLLEVRSKIGYLPENAPIYTDLSVIEYLDYIAELRSIPEEKKSDYIKDAIKKTQLEDKLDQLINTLSKGYRQRVGVAQAILSKPEILILDEPTNGLDPNQINEMRLLINDLSKESTVIISTHIMQEVEAVCDRVIIMSQGKIKIDKSLKELKNSNSLLLSVDLEKSKLSELLSSFSVSNLSLLDSQNNINRYSLNLEGDSSNLTSEISNKIITSGAKLFEITLERKSLESIFREI